MTSIENRSWALNTFLAFFFVFVQCSVVLAQQSATTNQESALLQSEALATLVTQITENSDAIGCHPGTCRVLVTDFVLANGQTSAFGMRLADALSSQLPQAKRPLLSADRTAFRVLLLRDRIPPRVPNEIHVACWLANQLHANAVIVGQTSTFNDGSTTLSIRFLSTDEKQENMVTAEAQFAVDGAQLVATDALPPPEHPPDSIDGEKVYIAGANGVSLPRCSYMPNPAYTNEARAAKFSGILLVKGIVATDGRLKAPFIVNGGPAGLNESTLKTLATWRCQPSQLDGKPVASLVPLEVTFRLY